jgi:hypothetical protein
MCKYFHQISEFEPLQEILKDPSATELRKANLNPLRNQLAFHFFEDAVGQQLSKSEVNPRFVTGQGEKNADVYYELADVCTLGAFSGLQLDQSKAVEQFAELAKTATDLAVRFVDAAETFVAKTLIADGWELHDLPPSPNKA